MAFNLSTFQGALASGGARPSLFSFDITGTAAGDTANRLSMLCNVAALPGVSITPIEKHYFGRVMKIPGDMVFADLTTTILMDDTQKTDLTKLSPRAVIEKWMSRLNTHEGNIREDAESMNTQNAVGTLTQYGKSQAADDLAPAAIYTVEFQGLFPTTLSEVAVSYDSVSEIAQFDCTWAYQYWNVA